jgi:hypothetical protein
MPNSDLIVEVFILLRNTFFDDSGHPVPFALREKRNTQDDPLDEYIANVLTQGLMDAVCQKSPGPLISPDLTIYRSDLCNEVPREVLKVDTSRIVAIEVKKLERTKGKIARATGLDYNTTPPCGIVRIYDVEDIPLDIRGFYLFVAQEKLAKQDNYILSALALCDGNILNEDFDFYLSITGQRSKDIGLGTYGDGLNRMRPMLVFANPLGASALDHAATLVNQPEVSVDHRLRLVYRIRRKVDPTRHQEFFAYRKASDVRPNWQVEMLDDPFPQPKRRVEVTQSRGKFTLSIKPSKS